MVTVVALYFGKSTNSEKAIYFLLLMSCSINKLKSHIIFTCCLRVFLGFPILRGKKIAPGNGGGMGAGASFPCLYGPDTKILNCFIIFFPRL